MKHPRLKSNGLSIWMQSLHCILFWIVLGAAMAGQSVRTTSTEGTTSSGTTKSRAEQEAEATVSLSAERIIALLNQEPGLLLQMKRMLVRKAYEQGRILESADLTDDSLFKLLREDDTIRVLATREIENRNYIRAKPTREEVEREKEFAANQGQRIASEHSPGARNEVHQPGTQEDAYWSTHDPLPARSIRPEQPWEWQYPPSPWQTPQTSKPQGASRQVQIASGPENQDFERLPMDLPAGPEYVLGPGDGLSIELWGAVSRRLQRVVDREGRVPLPEVGAVQVSGRTLGEVQHLLQSALRTQFHDVEADISLARIRSVRVYVVGDVVSPGAYDISSLSTPLNAIYAAGGPTLRGSLRHLRQYRGKQLVQEVDAYDLLLNGVHGSVANMQPGDSILVPPVGAEVTVEGMVRRPAIYEVNGEKSLAEVLDLAGGVLASGTLRHVDVERIVAHERRTMLRVELPEGATTGDGGKTLREFLVQDGDKIKISPILPYANQAVYLDGHVFRPGKYPYNEGMKVTDLIRSYNDLLPEPSKHHAEIIRLQAPDYSPTVLAFNLADAMGGSDQNLTK